TGMTLKISTATALGATSAGTTVNTGSQLQISGTITVAEPLILNGTGLANDGALVNFNNVNTWSGTITLGSSGVRVNSTAGTLTIAGGITGSGNPSLTIGGASSVTVNTAPINIGTGTLTWDGALTLRLDIGNTMGAFNYNA